MADQWRQAKRALREQEKRAIPSPPPIKPRRHAVQKMECPCGYIYDPAEGDYDNKIEPGTAFADLPDDWVCPKCGAEKEFFYPVN